MTYTSGAELVIENDGNARIQMVTPNDKISGIEFGDTEASGAGYIMIETDNNMPTGLRMRNTIRTWYLLHSPSSFDRVSLYDSDATGTRERLTIAGGTGYVGIHKTNPTTELDIAGKLYASDNSSGIGGYAGQFYNTNTAGTGLTATGNNTTTWYYGNGTGLNSTGYHVGAYIRANEAISNGSQRSISCDLGTGDYAYVCYRNSMGGQYNIFGSGITAAAMPTTKGYRTLAASESPEAWIEDYGSAEVKGGFCHVDLDPLLLDCVTIDEENPAKVFVQLTSPITNQFYVKKGSTGFDVIVTSEGAETVSATFDYRVAAARKNHEKLRFVEAESPEAVQAQARMVESQAPEEE